jgi:hypothetical protein
MFYVREAAERHALRLTAANLVNRREPHLVSIYLCRSCGAWHMTSKRQWDGRPSVYEDLKEKNDAG